MNLSNDEIYKLKQLLNKYKRTNAFDNIVPGSSKITIVRSGCDTTVIDLAATGTDFGSFDGITMATIYVSDATNPSNTTKTTGYIPKLTGGSPSFDIQLLLTQGDPINTSTSGHTRTIEFVSRFKDLSNNLHFVTLKVNIPQLNNAQCANAQAITYTIDDF
jgi:hypothetical protein